MWQRELGYSPETNLKAETGRLKNPRSTQIDFCCRARAIYGRHRHRERGRAVALIYNFIVLDESLRNSGARSQ